MPPSQEKDRHPPRVEKQVWIPDTVACCVLALRRACSRGCQDWRMMLDVVWPNSLPLGKPMWKAKEKVGGVAEAGFQICSHLGGARMEERGAGVQPTNQCSRPETKTSRMYPSSEKIVTCVGCHGRSLADSDFTPPDSKGNWKISCPGSSIRGSIFESPCKKDENSNNNRRTIRRAHFLRLFSESEREFIPLCSSSLVPNLPHADEINQQNTLSMKQVSTNAAK